ncbi:hypothetical protein GCM10017655_50310 [Pseudomonas turukhanskensis]|jgi:hypothetical protein|uniref:Uncharacterized protein n=1 Tax=Pseudomonas turukhanskensis TaxID=1806536 RepID=A0A9W6KAV3_9PSED|nr:hypothetical protein GCM10017655_50310 [Pseudomonas turukhanskensis]
MAGLESQDILHLLADVFFQTPLIGQLVELVARDKLGRPRRAFDRFQARPTTDKAFQARGFVR